ncbi:ubiquitin fusion degradation UFD1 family protein [Actinidia rufa]|uniref:Ubiquitin fusion degradation UFD1 family protein n=1 Tax=Actinidia rufa TaxID=165716 RepID=A0A7J0HD36_9ERIC|nr:ubiquitin fusion degradation UFD1 family protein [Actinidia rufa]
MPLSVFDRLAVLRIEYPMVFKNKNPYTKRVSHCGVLEFSAEEGFVLLPDWMMKNLNLEEGQLVTLENTTLPKGTYMKIQPHSTNHNFNILEAKPSSAISVVETDCEVEFAVPLDYKETEKSKVESGKSQEETKFKPFMGVGRRLDGQPSTAPAEPSTASAESMVKEDGVKDVKEKNLKKDEQKFQPFTGKKYRLAE